MICSNDRYYYDTELIFLQLSGYDEIFSPQIHKSYS